MYDVRCIENYEDFWGENNKPMTNSITLIPAILIYNGDGPIIQPWHIQDPKNLRNSSPVQATERPDSSPSHVEVYLTDLNNNRISNYSIGDKILLVLRTENMIGKNVTVSIKDKKADFEYEGQRLVDDTLEDFSVTNDIETIELTVIPEQV